MFIHHFKHGWDPEDLGSERALNVNAGRGALWLVEHAKGQLVRRQYLHGGLRRGIAPRLFFRRDRARREFEVHQQVFQAGIPTLEPIGWSAQRRFPWGFHFWYYTLYDADAIPLPTFTRDCANLRAFVPQAAAILRQIYDLGIFHHDLNLNNWLVSGQRLLLIDFDGAAEHTMAWGEYVTTALTRMTRSALKLGLTSNAWQRAQWRLLLTLVDHNRAQARHIHSKILEDLPPVALRKARWMLSGGHRN